MDKKMMICPKAKECNELCLRKTPHRCSQIGDGTLCRKAEWKQDSCNNKCIPYVEPCTESRSLEDIEHCCGEPSPKDKVCTSCENSATCQIKSQPEPMPLIGFGDLKVIQKCHIWEPSIEDVEMAQRDADMAWYLEKVQQVRKALLKELEDKGLLRHSKDWNTLDEISPLPCVSWCKLCEFQRAMAEKE